MGNTETCLECGKPGIQGQPFSGGQEYYCPNCEEVYSYSHVHVPSPQIDMVAFFDTAIELVEDAVDCRFVHCPGPDEPFQDMLTCRVCALIQHFRKEREKWRLLGTPGA